jgi:hypothetical protein
MTTKLLERPLEPHVIEPTRTSLRDLILAWMAGGCVPLAVAVGQRVSDAYVTSRGYDVAAGGEPAGIALLAFLFFSLVVLVPVLAAGWFGFRAHRGGRPTGMAPAVFAAVLAGAMVFLVGIGTL